MMARQLLVLLLLMLLLLLLLSHVTRHTSHVTRHTSHLTPHTSHGTRHTSLTALSAVAVTTAYPSPLPPSFLFSASTPTRARSRRVPHCSRREI